MRVAPVRFVKDHPVGTIVCLGIGYWLGGHGLMAIPFVGSLRGKASANIGDSGD